MSVPTLPPVLALAMRPLPLLPLQLLVTALLQRVCAQHPQIFDRLGEHAHKTFGIAPTDLPFAFVLQPDPWRPSLQTVRTLPADTDVRITAPLSALLALVEGKQDGDALMFSRDLVIEGDMEAVLALRNAIEDAQIDLVGDAFDGLGPLSPPVKRAVRGLMDAAAPQAPAHARAEPWS